MFIKLYMLSCTWFYTNFIFFFFFHFNHHNGPDVIYFYLYIFIYFYNQGQKCIVFKRPLPDKICDSMLINAFATLSVKRMTMHTYSTN